MWSDCLQWSFFRLDLRLFQENEQRYSRSSDDAPLQVQDDQNRDCQYVTRVLYAISCIFAMRNTRLLYAIGDLW